MIIYGIKNCDKVRAALKQAKQAGEDVRLHDFRSDGIDVQLLEAMLADIDISQLINKRSTTYRQLDKDTQQNVGIETLAAFPTLIKRPVVFHDNHFTLGLPS
ncbi:ArsC/Spx/MgsR family protein [Marinicella gelatinilytica]|uniref:ArsC/Spx/MgsR family protein n=1 Tax=Marinicella gelatinilytica TaxID=2996017 RepID=UPI002260C7B7|nr:ArsC/Spx/MgsR family protein [Marinicella gelatinilytica]MCX7545109.1 arsenate reductase [Marinicella gelatinilytica]